jgi:hypothetical protein
MNTDQRRPILLRLTRDVPMCESCADRDMRQGEIVHRFRGATYGCITPSGTACSISEDGGIPFFEMPTDALVPVEDGSREH